jgi:hypothetical protein
MAAAATSSLKDFTLADLNELLAVSSASPRHLGHSKTSVRWKEKAAGYRCDRLGRLLLRHHHPILSDRGTRVTCCSVKHGSLRSCVN